MKAIQWAVLVAIFVGSTSVYAEVIELSCSNNMFITFDTETESVVVNGDRLVQKTAGNKVLEFNENRIDFSYSHTGNKFVAYYLNRYSGVLASETVYFTGDRGIRKESYECEKKGKPKF